MWIQSHECWVGYICISVWLETSLVCCQWPTPLPKWWVSWVSFKKKNYVGAWQYFGVFKWVLSPDTYCRQTTLLSWQLFGQVRQVEVMNVCHCVKPPLLFHFVKDQSSDVLWQPDTWPPFLCAGKTDCLFSHHLCRGWAHDTWSTSAV